jgi:HPt (histidine-containing phosphotransfer) domain-containing protein
VLNIERGLKLWQDLSPYMQALQRFATAKTNWLQLPQHQQAPEPVTAAFEEAHRLKGVAANLGLLGLERSALAVEVAARSTPAGDVGTAWAGLRQAVSTAVAAVQQLDARPVAASADSPSTLSSEELAGLHRHLAQLREAFKRGECLDKLVTQVCQQVQTLLPASEVTALNQAIDDFDFDAAATCVERMAQGLPQPERLDAAL